MNPTGQRALEARDIERLLADLADLVPFRSLGGEESGIPTDLYGPGTVRRAHAPDEFVPIAELETAARVLVLTILRFCGIRERGRGGRRMTVPHPVCYRRVPRPHPSR